MSKDKVEDTQEKELSHREKILLAKKKILQRQKRSKVPKSLR